MQKNSLWNAVDQLVHVWREGGKGRIAVPDPQTGRLAEYEIDQQQAEEMIVWMMDQIIADIRRCDGRGEPLSARDREVLRLYQEQVPHWYTWSAPPGGPSYLLPHDSNGNPIGALRNEILLAAHPATFDIGWITPKTNGGPGFSGPIRLHESHPRWRHQHVADLRFPPEASLLTAWTRFDHLNADFAARRLSKADHLRYFLPYGVWTQPDGIEVLFNREYQPIYKRLPGDKVIAAPDPREWITHTAQNWFYDDSFREPQKRRAALRALKAFLAGEPVAGLLLRPDDGSPLDRSKPKKR